MGFDVVVIRPSAPVPSLLDPSFEPLPLGSPAEIRRICCDSFPGLNWDSERDGLWIRGEEVAIEFGIPDDPQPTSLHLTIRSGLEWTEETGW